MVALVGAPDAAVVTWAACAATVASSRILSAGVSGCPLDDHQKVVPGMAHRAALAAHQAAVMKAAHGAMERACEWVVAARWVVALMAHRETAAPHQVALAARQTADM